jgi:hypothetical protein
MDLTVDLLLFSSLRRLPCGSLPLGKTKGPVKAVFIKNSCFLKKNRSPKGRSRSRRSFYKKLCYRGSIKVLPEKFGRLQTIGLKLADTVGGQRGLIFLVFLLSLITLISLCPFGLVLSQGRRQGALRSTKARGD